MDHKNAAELTAELNADPSFVDVTIGLDTGRLIKSATHTYFIAPRMGGWEVVEQSLLSDVSRVEKKSNFMGDTFVIHTKSGRWMCKEVTENVDLRTWILQKARVTRASKSSTKNTEVSSNRTTVKKESPQQSEWESSTASVSKSETDSANFFSVSADPLGDSLDGFDDSVSDREILSEEIESNFISTTERPAQSVQPTERLQQVDDLLQKIESSEDETQSGCGSGLVKFIIFVWVFNLLLEMCS